VSLGLQVATSPGRLCLHHQGQRLGLSNRNIPEELNPTSFRFKACFLHTSTPSPIKLQTYSATFFPLLARDSALTQSNKLTLYTSLIRSILTDAAPVWSSTCSSNYLRLQVIQSKNLRVIGNHPNRTPTSHLHNSLNIKPIPVLIHRLTDKFFAHCPSHPNLPVQQIGNYTVADLTNLCKKYKQKLMKHILRLLAYRETQCFFVVHNFSLPLFAPIFIHILFTSTCTTMSVFH
jgi:hypothetical protein